MESSKLIKTSVKVFSALCVTSFLLVGCIEKHNFYDPDFGKNQIPVEGLPDFSTRSEISLNVDYETPGRKVLVQVFTENPFDFLPDGSVLQKENLLPVFAAFTDDNTKLTTSLALPTTVKDIYLCCPTMGMQSCIPLTIVNNTIDYKASTTGATARGYNTRTTADFEPVLRTVDESRKLYAFCEWNQYGSPTKGGYFSPADANNEMISWLQKTLWNGNPQKPNNLNNSKWVKDESITNITILKKMKDKNGDIVDVKEAAISLTFVSEGAWFQDVLGYYYYPTDKKPTDPSTLKKYIIIPNASKAGNQPYGLIGDVGEFYPANLAPLKNSQKISLWYVDENKKVHEKFPPGYTIGWFVIPNGFSTKSTTLKDNTLLYSNKNLNANNRGCCISLTYNGRVVVGIEDSNSDASYEDLLFYVEADPEAAIYNPDRPTIDEGGKTITGTEKTQGTYAFEDQWPNKGDYDLNDVVIEYERVTTFNGDNKVTKIVDTFKPVQRKGSATYHNAFSYQVDAAQIGKYTLPEGAIYEESTNSFILFKNAASELDRSFTITREFPTPTFVKSALKPYNPFIIVNYVKDATTRGEVHLPKRKPTTLADEKLINTKNDIYYIDIDGKHPFAIDIPIWGIVQPKESNAIENEYPFFTSWVDKGCGTEDADWYTKHTK